MKLVKLIILGSGCVAQLVERSLPTPEVRGSNPVIGKNLFTLNICLLSTVYWKHGNKEKRGRECLFKKRKVNNTQNAILLSIHSGKSKYDHRHHHLLFLSHIDWRKCKNLDNCLAFPSYCCCRWCCSTIDFVVATFTYTF